jgi:hypothetical protein
MHTTTHGIIPAALLIAFSAAYAAPVPSDSLVNFGKEDSVTAGVAGTKYWGTDYYNTAGMANDNTPTGPARTLKNRTNVLTDITLSFPNLGGFSNPDRGNGVSYTYNGFTFYGNLSTVAPNYNNPMQSYLADNIGSSTSTRDGLTVLRFSSPEQYSFLFTMVASYHNLTDGDPPSSGQADAGIDSLFNIGGTYSMSRTAPQNGSFAGGTTVHLYPQADGNYDRDGATISGQSTWDVAANAYVLDLQMGVGSVGNMAAISALRIQTDTVPEPATASSAGAAGLLLGMRWRRA